MTQDKADLSPYKLLIATPVMDGRPESTYKNSLNQTKQMLEAHGSTLASVDHKYCADISLARAKLLSYFLRAKDFTHMLMIDADMGWKPEDVGRMLLLNRDFIAAVGPKKQYPICFAFQNVDDYSRVQPVLHELETNVGEFTEVGAAFLMISRACAERIVAAYPELEFDEEPGVTGYSVFDPLIINVGKDYPRRRLSEDYAFCYRWRKIGGKVQVLMDVELTHTGPHTFKGCLLTDVLMKDPEFNTPDGTCYAD